MAGEYTADKWSTFETMHSNCNLSIFVRSTASHQQLLMNPIQRIFHGHKRELTLNKLEQSI